MAKVKESNTKGIWMLVVSAACIVFYFRILNSRETYDNWYCINTSNDKASKREYYAAVDIPRDKMTRDELETFLQTLTREPGPGLLINETSLLHDDAQPIAKRVVDKLNGDVAPLNFFLLNFTPLGKYTGELPLYKLSLTLTEITNFFQLQLLVIVDESGNLIKVETTTSKKNDTFHNKIADMSTAYAGIKGLSTNDAFQTSLERMTAAHRAKS